MKYVRTQEDHQHIHINTQTHTHKKVDSKIVSRYVWIQNGFRNSLEHNQKDIFDLTLNYEGQINFDSYKLYEVYSASQAT